MVGFPSAYEPLFSASCWSQGLCPWQEQPGRMRGPACWGPREPLLFGAWACTLPPLRRFSSSSDRSSIIWVKTHSDKGDRNVFPLSLLCPPAPTETCSVPPVERAFSRGCPPFVDGPASWPGRGSGRGEGALLSGRVGVAFGKCWKGAESV